MINEILGVVLDDDNDNQAGQQKNNKLRLYRRSIRDAIDPFSIPEEQFRHLHRFTIEGALLLIKELIPVLPQSSRRDAIPVHLQVLSTLNFLSGGSYQRKVGGDFLACVSQTSVSRFVHRVVDGLNAIMRKWVSFPTTVEEIQRIQQGFWERYNFPGVMGLIDGTHVKIVKPAGNRETHFVNRKHTHSLNVQVVCDHELRILSINASHGGRAHDSRVFVSSYLSVHLRQKYEAGRRDCWLLGDSGYPLLPYLMTPALHQPQGTPGNRYTKRHARTRSTVERCFAAWKGLWRCLLKDRTLHYTPEFAGQICNACAVLHNMIIKWKIPQFQSSVEDSNDEEEEMLVDEEVEYPDDIPFRVGQRVRDELISEYFTR